MAEIQLYDLALFAHITAVVVAFGATFAYPFFQVGIERVSPRSVPAMLRAMHTTSRYLVTPGSLVVLASGVYLTIERWDFDQLFVLVGLVIVVAVIVLGAGYFDRQEARAMQLAERDVASAGNGEVVLSDEYWALSRRLSGVGMAASLLILVAIFFMAVKP
jgi:Predicted integral membrane protein (DUF2269)